MADNQGNQSPTKRKDLNNSLSPIKQRTTQGDAGDLNTSQRFELGLAHLTISQTGGSPARVSGQESPVDEKQHSSQLDEIKKQKQKIDGIVETLDQKLNLVLQRQEYEYLKSYNIYVKRKEKELRELIHALNQKNQNNTLKDEKISNLEKTIQSIVEARMNSEKEKEKQAKEIKKLKSENINLEKEKKFMHEQVLEAKRENKLLKLAIGRIQAADQQKKETQSQVTKRITLPGFEYEQKSETFLTDAKIADHHVDILQDAVHNLGKDAAGLSVLQNSNEADTQAQTSYIDAHNSYFTNGLGINHLISQSLMQSQIKNSARMDGRAQTRSPQSRYRNIPVQNLKFEKFIELLFESKMSKEDIKDEIIKYVQLLETNYTEIARDLRFQVDKEKKQTNKFMQQKGAEQFIKSDFESLFVECIEEVRKDIMRRRLKTEIGNKKKFQKIERFSEEAREFEQSLLKLAELAKNRVKIGDFTAKDKVNLLELFVNNEKTLLKIYELLFPHRAGPNQGQAVSQSMVQDSGSGVYGQNAIGSFVKDQPRIVSKITLLNEQLLQDAQDDKKLISRGKEQFPSILPQVKSKQMIGNQFIIKNGVDRSMTADNQRLSRQEKQFISSQDNGQVSTGYIAQTSHLGVTKHQSSMTALKNNY